MVTLKTVIILRPLTLLLLTTIIPRKSPLRPKPKINLISLVSPFILVKLVISLMKFPLVLLSPEKGPLEEGFNPLKYYPCSGNPADPEYHPLRPYPGSPCDPLISRSVPEAPLTSEKKFNTFCLWHIADAIGN